jgi:hypothetical protein
MTRTLAVDDTNDIFIGPDGALSVVTDLQAVLFACAQAVQAQLGEMMLAVDEGMPNFQTIWNGAPNLVQFEAYLRRTLTAVEGVNSVETVTIEVGGRALRYVATIATIYGPGVVNGV